MARVEPIRSEQKVRDIINYLKKDNERNAVLFMLGIYTGLRVSDILKLKIGEIRSKDCRGVILTEKKTKHKRAVEFNEELKMFLQEFIESKDDEEYLIKSKKGKNKAISYTQAYRIIKKVGEDFFLSGNIGTHSMRKTYAYHVYHQKGNDLALTQTCLGHSSSLITIKYLGIENQTVNNANKSLKF